MLYDVLYCWLKLKEGSSTYKKRRLDELKAFAEWWINEMGVSPGVFKPGAGYKNFTRKKGKRRRAWGYIIPLNITNTILNLKLDIILD